ncbi:MAG: cytochrome c biogenesis CcdA family protein [Methanobacteriota archaeon]
MSHPVPLEMSVASRRGVDPRAVLLLGIGALALLALAGYGVFVFFVTGGASLAPAGFLLVAVVAGAGAFFSPCSFPLLPSYFAYAQAVGRRAARTSGATGAIARGLAASGGVVTFNVLLGLVFAVAGLGVAQSLPLLSPSPSAVTVALRAVVGGALVALGGVQLANLSVHGGFLDRFVRAIQPRDRAREPLIELFLYGFAYTVVGIGCTAPFLATVIVLALASGGFLAAFAGFLVFALTMSTFMLLASVVAVGPHRGILKGLSARTPAIKRAGGAALAAFGAIVLVTTVWPGLLAPLFP